MNGIDLAPFAAADPQFWLRHPQVGERAPLLGAVGAFYKGQEELIGLLPSLIEEFPRLALILIGEDEERKHLLQQLAQQSGVAEAVVFAGRIPREQMKDALCGLDLNVSAFRNEGFGLSVVEGLAGGTRFVGYRAGGYPEIVSAAGAGSLVDTPPPRPAAPAGRSRRASAWPAWSMPIWRSILQSKGGLDVFGFSRHSDLQRP